MEALRLKTVARAGGIFDRFTEAEREKARALKAGLDAAQVAYADISKKVDTVEEAERVRARRRGAHDALAAKAALARVLGTEPPAPPTPVKADEDNSPALDALRSMKRGAERAVENATGQLHGALNAAHLEAMKRIAADYVEAAARMKEAWILLAAGQHIANSIAAPTGSNPSEIVSGWPWDTLKVPAPGSASYSGPADTDSGVPLILLGTDLRASKLPTDEVERFKAEVLTEIGAWPFRF